MNNKFKTKAHKFQVKEEMDLLMINLLKKKSLPKGQKTFHHQHWKFLCKILITKLYKKFRLGYNNKFFRNNFKVELLICSNHISLISLLIRTFWKTVWVYWWMQNLENGLWLVLVNKIATYFIINNQYQMNNHPSLKRNLNCLEASL